MTTVRQILRYARRLGQASECSSKALNRSVRCASTQLQPKIIEDVNGKRIFASPCEFTPSEMFIHEYVWKNVDIYENHTALICAATGKTYTYSEARDTANYIARSLLNMDLRKGDVVALIAPNYPESILAFLGILEADLIVTTVNPFYTPDEIKKQLQSSGAKAIVTVAEISKHVLTVSKATLPAGAPVVVIEDGTGPVPEGTVPFKDLVDRGKTLPPLKHTHTSVNDMAVLPYSSGTTGLPKGVMLTHKNLVSNMEMTDKTASGTMFRYATSDFQEVVPLVLPFFHIFGMNSVVLPRLASGSQLISVPKFVPEQFIHILAKYKVTGLCVVPPLVLFLNATPHVKKDFFKNMHHVIIGAAPLAEADVERFYDKFQMDSDKLKFCQGYGLTETSPAVCMEVTGKKMGSVGKNVIGCDLRLVDPITNEDVTVSGQTGEIWVRGPHVMRGYFNNEAATNEMIVEGGWLKTGDIAYCDDDLDFFVTDRLKELIKVKGFQVPPAELEAILRTHPDVVEAAVVGIPDERCGEVPKAYILAKKGSTSTEENIKNFMKGKVSDYKELQGGVTFVNDIPKNASGKILRAQLKSQYK
ncbi:4-coumarate--CoA ligase 1 [Colletes gigas]|uniref:4-coumarate--CoA ligase 1 n=1 Tax=Colletes gigas TaxID=935657 RepID=UPI001C9B9D2C|nr:4-coumarate--CoA ligase 1 [Colletes gigas]